MKKMLLLALLLIGTNMVKAQETFFPTREGTELVYKMFDKKDKLISMMRYAITHIRTDGDDMEITYQVASMNSKEEIQYKEEVTIYKKGDKMIVDMGNFINKAAFQQDGEMPPNIEITGNQMEIPISPQPGTLLPDAKVEMALKMGFINLKLATNITNRRVEKVEDISVPAGIFACYKFTSDVTSTVMGKKVNSSLVEWYAKGIGVIKSENYDKQGKLESYMVLAELK
jgi:hypothetical protein